MHKWELKYGENPELLWFLDFFYYQNSDAKIKDHDFYIEQFSSSIELPIGPMMEKGKGQAWSHEETRIWIPDYAKIFILSWHFLIEKVPIQNSRSSFRLTTPHQVQKVVIEPLREQFKLAKCRSAHWYLFGHFRLVSNRKQKLYTFRAQRKARSCCFFKKKKIVLPAFEFYLSTSRVWYKSQLLKIIQGRSIQVS